MLILVQGKNKKHFHKTVHETRQRQIKGREEVEGHAHEQSIATDKGKSGGRKGDVELVADEGSDVTRVKVEGRPNREGARLGDLAM